MLCAVAAPFSFIRYASQPFQPLSIGRFLAFSPGITDFCRFRRPMITLLRLRHFISIAAAEPFRDATPSCLSAIIFR